MLDDILEVVGVADVIHRAGKGLDTINVLEYLPKAVPRLLNVVDRPLEPRDLVRPWPDHRVVVGGLANVVYWPNKVVKFAGVGYDLVKVALVLWGAIQLLKILARVMALKKQYCMYLS